MLVILDRDGVINADSPDYIRAPDQWHALAGSLAAIAQLKQAGHTVVVATNQSGVGRGYYTEATMHEIHQVMHHQLAAHGAALDGVYYCPHAPAVGCACRKPKPGMLHAIMAAYPVDPAVICFVGDSWRDVQAAQGAGIQPVLVKTGNGAETIEAHRDDLQGIMVHDDLLAFAMSVA
jgi:D-glycero-D-manno-heptose 1,7-bisphosphate phosphatase